MTSWKALQVIRGKFMVSYHLCAIKGESVAVAACLAPAFEELLNRLPPIQTNTSPDWKADARTANALVLSQAHEAFRVCIFAKIKELDDGISSARDIALGVGPACRLQAMDLANIRLSAGNTTFIADSPTIKDRFDLSEQLSNPDQLVANVLEYRAQKRTPLLQPKKRIHSRKIES